MVIINFANKWEIIIIIRDKKNRDKFFVRWKKSGKNTGREKESRGKISSGKNLVTCKKFSYFSSTFFSLIRYLFKTQSPAPATCMFSCEVCEIFKNAIFHRTHAMVAFASPYPWFSILWTLAIHSPPYPEKYVNK